VPTSKPESEWADSTRQAYEILSRADLNPRVRMALRMYAFGACKTLGEAAAVVGISPMWLSQKKNSPAGKAYMESAQQILDDKTANTAEIISRLGMRGLQVIGQFVEDTGDKKLQLRAAIDLADRAPETSKVQKIQVESFTLANKDAKALAEALVAGRSVNELYGHLREGNLDKVTESKEPLQLPAGPNAPPSESGT
jgi:hypothetical protein